jgi:hypothetical protein
MVAGNESSYGEMSVLHGRPNVNATPHIVPGARDLAARSMAARTPAYPTPFLSQRFSPRG